MMKSLKVVTRDSEKQGWKQCKKCEYWFKADEDHFYVDSRGYFSSYDKWCKRWLKIENQNKNKDFEYNEVKNG